MKSRFAIASAILAPAERVAAADLAARGATMKAAKSVLAMATAPRASGHAECAERLHPTAMQLKTATCTVLSPQKSSAAPPGDSRNFNRAISPSQPSRIECRRKRSAPVSWSAGAEDRKNGAPARPIARQTRVTEFGVTDVQTRCR